MFFILYTLFFLHRGLVYVISYFFTQRFDIRQQLFLFVLAIVPSTNKFLKFSKLEILLIGLIVIGLTLSFPTVVFVELLVTTIFSDEVGLKKFIILRGDGITSGISIIIFANTISTKEEELKRKGQRFKIQNECIFIYIYELQQCYEIKIYASYMYLRVPFTSLCLSICGYYLSIIVNITDYNYYKNTTTNIIIIN